MYFAKGTLITWSSLNSKMHAVTQGHPCSGCTPPCILLAKLLHAHVLFRCTTDSNVSRLLIVKAVTCCQRESRRRNTYAMVDRWGAPQEYGCHGGPTRASCHGIKRVVSGRWRARVAGIWWWGVDGVVQAAKVGAVAPSEITPISLMKKNPSILYWFVHDCPYVGCQLS